MMLGTGPWIDAKRNALGDYDISTLPPRPVDRFTQDKAALLREIRLNAPWVYPSAARVDLNPFVKLGNMA